MKIITNKILFVVGAMVAFQPVGAEFNAVGYGLLDLIGKGVSLEWLLPKVIKNHDGLGDNYKKDDLKNKSNGDFRETLTGIALNAIILPKSLEKTDLHAAFWGANAYGLYRNLYTLFPVLNISQHIKTYFGKENKEDTSKATLIKEDTTEIAFPTVALKAAVTWGIRSTYMAWGALEGAILSVKNPHFDYALSEGSKRTVRNPFLRWVFEDKLRISKNFYDKKKCETYGDLSRQAAYYVKHFVLKNDK